MMNCICIILDMIDLEHKFSLIKLKYNQKTTAKIHFLRTLYFKNIVFLYLYLRIFSSKIIIQITILIS